MDCLQKYVAMQRFSNDNNDDDTDGGNQQQQQQPPISDDRSIHDKTTTTSVDNNDDARDGGTIEIIFDDNNKNNTNNIDDPRNTSRDESEPGGDEYFITSTTIEEDDDIIINNNNNYRKEHQYRPEMDISFSESSTSSSIRNMEEEWNDSSNRSNNNNNNDSEQKAPARTVGSSSNVNIPLTIPLTTDNRTTSCHSLLGEDIVTTTTSKLDLSVSNDLSNTRRMTNILFPEDNSTKDAIQKGYDNNNNAKKHTNYLVGIFNSTSTSGVLDSSNIMPPQGGNLKFDPSVYTYTSSNINENIANDDYETNIFNIITTPPPTQRPITQHGSGIVVSPPPLSYTGRRSAILGVDDGNNNSSQNDFVIPDNNTTARIFQSNQLPQQLPQQQQSTVYQRQSGKSESSTFLASSTGGSVQLNDQLQFSQQQLQQQQQQERQNQPENLHHHHQKQRPPRIPIGTTTNSTNTTTGSSIRGAGKKTTEIIHSSNQHHQRGNSSGDSSWLSALTESDSIGSSMMNHSRHSRIGIIPDNPSEKDIIDEIPLPTPFLSPHHTVPSPILDLLIDDSSIPVRRTDIPAGLQQPILDDESSIIEKHNNDDDDPFVGNNNFHQLLYENQEGDRNRESPGDLPVTKRIEVATGENVTSEDSDADAHSSPHFYLHHTRDSSRVQQQQQQQLHHRLTKISEFETEAETALLNAIEKELNTKTSNDYKNDILPGIPDDAASLFDPPVTRSPARDDNKKKNDDENLGDDDNDNNNNDNDTVSTNKLTTARMQWLAFQQAMHPKVDDDDNVTRQSFRRFRRRISTKPESSSSSDVSSADTLLRSMGILMNNTIQDQNRRRQSTVIPTKQSTSLEDKTKRRDRKSVFDHIPLFGRNEEEEKPTNQSTRVGVAVTFGDSSQRSPDDEKPEPTSIGTDAEIANDPVRTKTKNAKARDITETVINMPSNFRTAFQRNITQMRSDWEAFHDFLKPQKSTVYQYIHDIVLYLFVPSLFIAFILFYIAENPPTGRQSALKSTAKPHQASVSWWIVFVGVRHPIVYSMARATELILIHFLGVSSPRFMKLTGPYFGLLIAQSKGWPAILFFHGMYSFLLLCGRYPFFQHWGSWQNVISIFNQENPAGDVTYRYNYELFLISFMVIGAIVSVKRLYIGLKFGQRLYERYNQQLTAVMEKMVLLSEISSLTAFTDHPVMTPSNTNANIMKTLSVDSIDTVDGTPSRTRERRASVMSSSSASPKRKKVFTSNLGGDDPTDIMNLLDDWVEPSKIHNKRQLGSLAEILEFRQTYLLMQTSHPFSIFFGFADTRANCAASAAKVYQRLQRRQQMIGLSSEDENGDTDNLDFGLLCDIALRRDGSTDKEKVKRLVRMFRPNRHGKLTELEFIKSVDATYRELRTLSANIQNASAIDRAFEKIFNVFFYFMLSLLILFIHGINGMQVFLSFFGTFALFAFAIGPACSLYLEGVLLILVRKPYDIGDRVALSDGAQDTDPAGSMGWIIENIDLFTTTMRYGVTREVATVSNGSIARLRIINMNRSDKANIMIFLKFGVETPYQKIKIFHKAVEQFVYDRPREWVKSFVFRSTRVEADLGYVEYIIILQHRESWQNVGSVLESRAKVASFCLELQKQLDMRYHSPPMPIELNMADDIHPGIRFGTTATQHQQNQPSPSYNGISHHQRQPTETSGGSVDLDAVKLIKRPSDAGRLSAVLRGGFMTDEILAASRFFDTKKDR